MNVAALRGAGTTGLVMIALAVLSPTALGAEGVSTDGFTRCPCDAGLPVGQVGAPPAPTHRLASVRGRPASRVHRVECPCNAGLPGGPPGVPLTI